MGLWGRSEEGVWYGRNRRKVRMRGVPLMVVLWRSRVVPATDTATASASKGSRRRARWARERERRSESRVLVRRRVSLLPLMLMLVMMLGRSGVVIHRRWGGRVSVRLMLVLMRRGRRDGVHRVRRLLVLLSAVDAYLAVRRRV